MSEAKINKEEKKDQSNSSNVSVLIIDDDIRVINSIKVEAEIRGYKRFSYATTIHVAIKIIEEKNIDVISTDYDMTKQKIENELTDGIGLLKYLITDPIIVLKAKRLIVYTGLEKKDIKDVDLNWCAENGVEIITKSNLDNHNNLFESINTFFSQPSHLPDNPKFAYMKEDEILLTLANDLLQELELNKDAHFSFGSDHSPMKNSDLIREIKNLTPLGKEVIGNWFSGVKRNLNYLHKERLKQKK